MKLKVITTSDNGDHEGWKRLEASLIRYGYDFERIQHPFSFGHQLPVIRDWCEKYGEHFTHILYTDCFDTLAFGGPEEVLAKFRTFETKMLISCEKACYPHPERAKDYPETKTPWKYVNGGGWLVEIEYFKELCKKENLNEGSHDQVWLMESFLRNQNEIKLDNNCMIFQSIAFSNVDEWQLFKEKEGNRFRNVGTMTYPIFFHGNGHTDMNWLKTES